MNSKKQLNAVLALLLFRLSGLVIFLAVVSLVIPRHPDNVAMYAFIGFAFMITIPYSLWLRNQSRTLQFMPLQFLVDVTLVSGLVYFTGGFDSDFNVLYPLIILSTGILATPKEALQITALSIVVYILLIALLLSGVLVPFAGQEVPAETGQVLSVLTVRVLVFALFGAASAYVSQRCNYVNRKQEQFRELAEVIFRNVRAGLLLLDEKDTILLANTRTCELLGYEPGALAGSHLSDVRIENAKPASGLDNPTASFRRADGTFFPAAYEVSEMVLPGEAIPRLKSRAPVKVSILVFTDITNLVQMQEKTREMDCVRAAADMAAEVAHNIRTPLTAIAGAVQMLEHFEQQEISLPEKERKELLIQIFTQTDRIDRTLQKLLDCVEFRTDDLNTLLDLDLKK